jgi:hypothetical protein
MAICEYCLLEMHDADGCRKLPVQTAEGDFDPIPYGSESRVEPPRPGQRCHDCCALPGNYHHVGCDWEECPRCHRQLIGCDCVPVEDEAEPESASAE